MRKQGTVGQRQHVTLYWFLRSLE